MPIEKEYNLWSGNEEPGEIVCTKEFIQIEMCVKDKSGQITWHGKHMIGNLDIEVNIPLSQGLPKALDKRIQTSMITIKSSELVYYDGLKKHKLIKEAEDSYTWRETEKIELTRRQMEEDHNTTKVKQADLSPSHQTPFQTKHPTIPRTQYNVNFLTFLEHNPEELQFLEQRLISSDKYQKFLNDRNENKNDGQNTDSEDETQRNIEMFEGAYEQM